MSEVQKPKSLARLNSKMFRSSSPSFCMNLKRLWLAVAAHPIRTKMNTSSIVAMDPLRRMNIPQASPEMNITVNWKSRLTKRWRNSSLENMAQGPNNQSIQVTNLQKGLKYIAPFVREDTVRNLATRKCSASRTS